MAPSRTIIEHRSGPAPLLFDETAARLQACASPKNLPATRIVRVLTVDATAVVLGNSQSQVPVGEMSPPAVRRRSGGGAVLLSSAMVWFDIIIAKSDPMWDDDVARSMWWVGQLFAESLASVGVSGLTVHRAPMVQSLHSRTICWLGVGPGEVFVPTSNGASVGKIVGIAQRRTPSGALFQAGVALQPSQYLLGEWFGVEADVIRAGEANVEVVRTDVVCATLAKLSDLDS